VESEAELAAQVGGGFAGPLRALLEGCRTPGPPNGCARPCRAATWGACCSWGHTQVRGCWGTDLYTLSISLTY